MASMTRPLATSSSSPAGPAGARRRNHRQRSTISAASMHRPASRLVCTGGMILAASGVLDGGPATTKIEVVPPEMSPISVMRETYPAIEVREAMLVQRPDGVVMGGGVTLCIDTTLHLLEPLLGGYVANETARIMEYSRAWRANREAFAPVVVADRAG